jgi:Putative phage integrase
MSRQKRDRKILARPRSVAQADFAYTRRRDPFFAWAAEKPGLNTWRGALVEWVAQLGSRSAAVNAGNKLLDFASEFLAIAASPETYCRRDAQVPSFTNWLRTPEGPGRRAIINNVNAFFSWFLDTKLSEPNDDGEPVRSPLHFNPVAWKKLSVRASETDKNPLPTRYIRELRHILTSNDFEWAKRFNDFVLCTDSFTGKKVEVWCPVRACVVALKLMLPLRTFQIRMLDSGEGDSLVYDQGKWVENTGPHAPSIGSPVAQGFLKPFTDPTSGEVITGFRPNTNKTADCEKDESDHGYDIPWEHKEVIAVVDKLRQWQARYNPIDRPTPWSEVRTPEVRLSGVVRSGSVYFLMREPFGKHVNQPIAKHRPESMWAQLLAALEERMAARGETAPNGERIRLTRLDKHGRPTPLYGLHSLRVSLLTALATEGEVPLHILSKIVAGHSSLVMTLYYVKVNPVSISRQLTEASLKVDLAETESFIASLAADRRNDESFVSNSPAGITALSRSNSGLWTTVDTGVCPVGGTRCKDGGPQIGKGRFAEVPGGQCVNCRFHITGPAFLPQLTGRFQTSVMALNGAKRHRDVAEKAVHAAANKQWLREQGGHRGASIELDQANNRLEEIDKRIAILATSMASAYRLTLRCVDAAKKTPGLNVVLAGSEADIEVAVRETSEIELWDAVCQSAHIHPCAEVDEAMSKRARAIDRMLVRHGQDALLLKLPPELEAVASSEMMRWLKVEHGTDLTFALLDGRTEGLPDTGTLIGDIARRLQHVAVAANATAPDKQFQLNFDGG